MAVDNIGIDSFPKQGSWLGMIVDVCFDHDPSRSIRGRIVREDVEEPGQMIIKLDDGRFVRSVECQYRLRPGETAMERN